MKPQEYQYKDFTYKADEKGRSIIIKENIESPKCVYKYYSMNKYSIDAFIRGYLYASHPFQFNDSIDSSYLLLDFSKITKERYINIWQQILFSEEFSQYDMNDVYE